MIAATPARDRHRDGEDVVDEQRRARDQRRHLAEVLAADDVRAAAARIGEDRLAVRRRRRSRAGSRRRSRSGRASRARARGSTARPRSTNRISCVAYAVDEIASDEKTASAIVLLMRWCSCSEVASGRPTSTRLKLSSTVVPSYARRLSGRQHAIAGAREPRTRFHAPAPADAVASAITAWDGRPVVHVVVIGCGRVGSELAGALEQAGHTRRGRRQERARLPPPRRPTSRARPSSASASTATTSPQAGIERGRGFRLCDERRQLEHPLRPDRPRDLRHRARRRPHLRPAPRARSTSGSASRPSRPSPGPPTRCCAGSCPARPATTGSTRPAQVGLVERHDPGQGDRAEARQAQPARACSGSPRSRASARRRS